MDVTNRDRLNVLDTMFTVIKDAHEYAHYEDGRNYYYFIYGIIAMTEMMLKEIDERPMKMEEELERHICINPEEARKALEDITNIYNTHVNGKLGE